MIQERCWFSPIDFFVEYFPHRINVLSFQPILCHPCEGEGDVVAVEAPLGIVAEVIFHGVQVVEVGVQVRVHEEGEKEKDGEVQVEVEREVEGESRTTTHV